VRWALVRELAGSDRRVRELTALLRLPQSLVSYHLGRLRAAGMVSARRSTADGRDSYYRLELERCRALLANAGSALHPALGGAAAPTPATGAERRRVLFLCTGNSARSQIAEALIEELSGGAVEAESAGSRPKPLHPAAVRVLAARGIDISDRLSKHFDGFVEQPFHMVISLCDRVREVCPEFPDGARAIHWSVPDPAAEEPDASDPDAAFERVAGEIEMRIGFLLHQLGHDALTREVANR
jgi:protein-tyrosine-phosphatase